MTHSTKPTKVLLTVAGSLAGIVGLASMLLPVQTEAGLGIAVGNSVSLLNELRASGGGLAAAGIFILAGAFTVKLSHPATLLATMLYFGYGFARALSMTLDGIPDPRLLQVTALELAIGLLCFALFIKQCRQSVQSH